VPTNALALGIPRMAQLAAVAAAAPAAALEIAMPRFEVRASTFSAVSTSRTS
jgi:hypothetical protein